MPWLPHRRGSAVVPHRGSGRLHRVQGGGSWGFPLTFRHVIEFNMWLSDVLCMLHFPSPHPHGFPFSLPTQPNFPSQPPHQPRCRKENDQSSEMSSCGSCSCCHRKVNFVESGSNRTCAVAAVVGWWGWGVDGVGGPGGMGDMSSFGWVFFDSVGR